jgi:GGDEF domain-containing protein
MERDRPHPQSERVHRGLIALLAGVASISAGVVDWHAGPGVSVLVLYLPTVAAAAWYLGLSGGLALSVFAGVVWLTAAVAGEPPPGVVHLWNAVVRTSIFALIAILISRLRKLDDVLRARDAAAEEDRKLQAGGGGAFYQRLTAEVAVLERHGRHFTLAYVDCWPVGSDGGTPRADLGGGELLEVLRKSLRAQDVVTSPRGRELALLLPDTGPAAAEVAFARLRARLSHDEHLLTGWSVNIGAVTCTEAPESVTALLQRAYQIMYTAPRLPGAVSIVLESEPPGAAPAPAPDGSSTHADRRSSAGKPGK